MIKNRVDLHRHARVSLKRVDLRAFIKLRAHTLCHVFKSKIVLSYVYNFVYLDTKKRQ